MAAETPPRESPPLSESGRGSLELDQLLLKRQSSVRGIFEQLGMSLRHGHAHDDGGVEVGDVAELLADRMGLDTDRPDIRHALAALADERPGMHRLPTSVAAAAAAEAAALAEKERPPNNPQSLQARRKEKAAERAARRSLEDAPVRLDRFEEAMADPRSVVRRALLGELAVPNFVAFCRELVRIYLDVRGIGTGRTVQYIPELRDVDPRVFSFSVCTVDGQRFSYGDAERLVCLQGCVTPFSYLAVLESVGVEATHSVVGQEPSGQPYNAVSLNRKNRPHNPFVNIGAIAICSLMWPDRPISDRFEAVSDLLSRLGGGPRYAAVEFSQPVYLSERSKADQNFALGYYLQGAGIVPGGRVEEFVDLYLQLGCIEANCSTLATMAASLALGGRCPLTKERVFKRHNVRRCLAALFSSGMFTYSGEWAFTTGMPAKSGVSGMLFAVVPHMMGVAIHSPLLDDHGSSVRAVEFCRLLTQRMSLGVFDRVSGSGASGLPDPRSADFVGCPGVCD